MFATFAIVLVSLTSCGKDNSDPEPDPEPIDMSDITGTWIHTETSSDGNATVSMRLTFNKNYTGSIIEDWMFQSKASSTETYSMQFEWSTIRDNGNDMLKVSYVSGDKQTELFPGSAGTVLWSRQYVRTGNILNIYQGSGVWVFNKL